MVSRVESGNDQGSCLIYFREVGMGCAHRELRRCVQSIASIKELLCKLPKVVVALLSRSCDLLVLKPTRRVSAEPAVLTK